ncbi:hypothetical protein QN277_010652 [Acacia crassicarpa]|uniref:Uncharacterized protein n=1 Tax=Acacia crassicarpa TaxID=499986 RepID=A0AAE1M513_9FABA|nr:hypothetical protein QN277_010652 [Acacia crassicarpa]
MVLSKGMFWIICANGSLMIYFVASCLQSTHMASQQITEEAVYLCTGNPLPKDIEQISYWLLNEQFADSFKRIYEIMTRIGCGGYCERSHNVCF